METYLTSPESPAAKASEAVAGEGPVSDPDVVSLALVWEVGVEIRDEGDSGEIEVKPTSEGDLESAVAHEGEKWLRKFMKHRLDEWIAEEKVVAEIDNQKKKIIDAAIQMCAPAVGGLLKSNPALLDSPALQIPSGIRQKAADLNLALGGQEQWVQRTGKGNGPKVSWEGKPVKINIVTTIFTWAMAIL